MVTWSLALVWLLYLQATTDCSCPASSLVPEGNNLFLNQGQSLEAGTIHLDMQSDGNLVLYNSNSAIWSTNTNNAHRAVMQTDGNFVLYTSDNAAIWNTQTSGNSGSFIKVQKDGNLVVYNSAGQGIWNSGTWGIDGGNVCTGL
ncbi:hypothetical protein CYMTET_49940 [Cymbomonas tetramitiformis]|uniref:Bulb-type lectin domain-containing protein n=1 Tax=Cymbomonas tetramitiformis TaxID=36881 RepID=A0AAE0BQK5_9CHLO|nr:hypothetical protein CYMTET_49940 [Cymbomonas tetramitiformis]